MPRGKAPVFIHTAAHAIGSDVDCDLTELFKLRKEEHPLPHCEVQAALCFEIQSAIAFYKNTTQKKYITSTQRYNDIRRFKLHARALLKAEKSKNSLLLYATIRSFQNSFKELDYTAHALIYNLFPCPVAISAFLNRFDLLLLKRQRDTSVAFLQKIADMPEDHLRLQSHHYSRPNLALLIRRVAPAFRAITGRSLLRSCNHYSEEERSYCFGIWLRSLFSQEHHPYMTDAMIEDVININKL